MGRFATFDSLIGPYEGPPTTLGTNTLGGLATGDSLSVLYHVYAGNNAATANVGHEEDLFFATGSGIIQIINNEPVLQLFTTLSNRLIRAEDGNNADPDFECTATFTFSGPVLEHLDDVRSFIMRPGAYNPLVRPSCLRICSTFRSLTLPCFPLGITSHPIQHYCFVSQYATVG